MNLEHEKQAYGLFQDAMQLAPRERTPFLRGACAGDALLKQRVQQLLGSAKEAERHCFTLNPGLRKDSDRHLKRWRPGHTIGPYRVLRFLGQGGMGQVYLVEQNAPFYRMAALKVFRGDSPDRGTNKRFAGEIQTLAKLNHPYIAQIYDAGYTAHGSTDHPYLVMEFVEGEPVTTYANRRRMTVAQRVDLMIKVCEAVSYAHEKGIIHRDLKPGNLLITERNGKPVPKIIDFGIAKVINQSPRLVAATRGQITGDNPTGTRCVIGSPGYMSPEQARVLPGKIDARTDVYALGVLLYELLVGCLPYDKVTPAPGLEGQDWVGQWQERAQAPSARLKRRGEAALELARNRSTGPKRLRWQCRGDLDRIVLRALARDQRKRYATPQALARALELIPGGKSESRFSRYFWSRNQGMKRNPILVTAVLSMVLALSLIAFNSGKWPSEDGPPNRGKSDAWVDVDSHDRPSPGRKDRHALAVQDSPTSESDSVHWTMALKYLARGALEKAYYHANQAWRRNTEQWGPGHSSTLSAKALTGEILLYRSEYDKAEPILRDCLNQRRLLLGAKHPDTLASMFHLALWALQNERPGEAEILLTELLAGQKQLVGLRHPEALDTMNHLVYAYVRQNKFAEAETMCRDTFSGRMKVLGEGHEQTVASQYDLIHILTERGKLNEAEELCRRREKYSQRSLGEDHSATLAARDELGQLMIRQAKWREAERIFRNLIEKRSAMHGKDHPMTLADLKHLGRALLAQGKIEEAETPLRRLLADGLGAPIDPADVLPPLWELADLYYNEGQHRQAITLAEDVWKACVDVYGADHHLSLEAKARQAAFDRTAGGL